MFLSELKRYPRFSKVIFFKKAFQKQIQCSENSSNLTLQAKSDKRTQKKAFNLLYQKTQHLMLDKFERKENKAEFKFSGTQGISKLYKKHFQEKDVSKNAFKPKKKKRRGKKINYKHSEILPFLDKQSWDFYCLLRNRKNHR